MSTLWSADFQHQHGHETIALDVCRRSLIHAFWSGMQFPFMMHVSLARSVSTVNAVLIKCSCNNFRCDMRYYCDLGT
eukprot:6490164-Amphidinium_carterae.1